MSTGHVISDSRIPTSTACGMAMLGTKYEKTWNGADGSKDEEHPYDMSLSILHDPGIWWDWKNSQSTPKLGSGVACGFAPAGACPGITDNQVAKVYSKLAGMILKHDFNAAVNVGEGKESLKMIASTAKSFGKAFLALKHGKPAKALDALGLSTHKTRVNEVATNLKDGAGNAWLGMTYGWVPLLGAVDDAMNALATSVYGKRTVTVQTRIKQVGSVFGVGGGFSAVGTCTRGRNIKWEVSEASISTAEEFGFASPSLVAWELLPYSFVADWFLPIGPWLEARSHLENIAGTSVTTDRFYLFATLGESPDYVILDGTCSRKEIVIHRTVGSVSDSHLPLPDFKNPLSTSHAISAIALLNNIFKH